MENINHNAQPYWKTYYTKNRDSISMKMKAYKLVNSDEVKAYNKEYYKLNKVHMLEKMTRKKWCDCCHVDVMHFPRHLRTLKHNRNVAEMEINNAVEVDIGEFEIDTE